MSQEWFYTIWNRWCHSPNLTNKETWAKLLPQLLSWQVLRPNPNPGSVILEPILLSAPPSWSIAALFLIVKNKTEYFFTTQ